MVKEIKYTTLPIDSSLSKPSQGPKQPAKIVKAFSVVKGEGGWQYLELTLNEDMDILEVKKSQPDVKAIITEMFKINVGKHWMKLEG